MPVTARSLVFPLTCAFAANAAAQQEAPQETKTPTVEERLSALVAFSRRLFGQRDQDTIVNSTCHAVRDILLAQCARLVVHNGGEQRHECIASGLDDEERNRLLGSQMYANMLRTLEGGGAALYPMSSEEAGPVSPLAQPGDFVFQLCS